MAKTWENATVVDIRTERIDKKISEQIIDEVARMVYDEICQLHKNSNLDSLTLQDEILQRTGTDG